MQIAAWVLSMGLVVVLVGSAVAKLARVPAVVDWARQAGFDQVSLDLIYGTPGESLADWEATLESALGLPPKELRSRTLTAQARDAKGAR